MMCQWRFSYIYTNNVRLSMTYNDKLVSDALGYQCTIKQHVLISLFGNKRMSFFKVSSRPAISFGYRAFIII